MLRRALLTAFAAALLADPAVAASAPAAGDQAYVEISPVALPIVAQGRLVNYVFVSVRLWARPGTDVTALRLREPFFRDALVRAAHRTSLAAPNDPNRVDATALARAIAPQAARIAGSPVFQRAEITSQTPQHRLRTPPAR